MPRFYFHLRTPYGLDVDDIGLDLKQVEDACREAGQALPEVAAELIRENHDLTRCAFVIADAEGQSIAEVPFSKPFQGTRQA